MKAKLIVTLNDGTKIQSSKILLDSMSVAVLSENVAGVTVSFLFSDMKAIQALVADMQR